MTHTVRAALLTVATLPALLPACAEPDAKIKDEASGTVGQARRGGDPDPCRGEASSSVIAWTAQTDLGRSASEAFDSIEGTCAAPFQWNGSVLGDRKVEPRDIDSEMNVTVELDQASARLVRAPADAPADLCPSVLEVDAKVRLKTPDGSFDETGTSTLRYQAGVGVLPFRVEVALEKHGGSLLIELGRNEQGLLSYSLDGAGASCAGNVTFGIAASMPDDHGALNGSAARVGQWSNTGCPLGEQLVDLTMPRGDRPSLREQTVDLWADAAYQGTWEDGENTTLSVRLSMSATVACGAEGDLNIPVEVTWGTADGRIVEHETAANVHLGSDGMLGLWISDEMICQHAGDRLQYTRASCAGLASVTLQFGLNSYVPDEVELAGDGVHVYATPRMGREPPKPETLTLLVP